jgi:uncharacterized protein YbaP (TraB family)
MKHIGRVVFILCVFLANTVQADAPVWKVSKGNFHIYIGGTIHILEEQDYPLPAEFEQAYELAEKLVFEVDIAQVNTLEFQQKLLQKALYRDGSTLASHLQPATFNQLQEFMIQRGIPLENLLSFKVGMLLTILTVNELQRNGIQGMGVDQYFNLKAREDKKPIAALETIEQQIEFLTSLGEGEEDQIVLQTIEELEHFGEEFSTLKSAWRSGDMPALIEVGLQDFLAFPRAYESMLVNRNRAWIPGIEAMLEDEQVEYVLLGVLHLVGNDSVLAMLKARGYHVEKL